MSKFIGSNESEPPTMTVDGHLSKKDISKLAMFSQFILNWLENESDIVLGMWNKDGKLLYVSKSVKNILDLDPKKLIGTGWEQLISTEDLIHMKEELKKGATKNQYELNISNDVGKSVLFECTLERVFDEEKKQNYFVGIFKNVETAQQTKEEMIQSEKMSVAGQLAAGIAHEIRNPLTSLKGFLQLLQAGINQKEVYYQIMSDELDKIETITSELLFISKPLTNKKEFESVQSMISDVMVLLNSQAHINNVKIVRKEASDYYIYCDRSQIKQVLINIIKNAIEATEESGTVTIQVRALNSKINIDVIDEGPGIPNEIIQKIGEPFFTTKEGGTGLGLMITKQILEQHQGELDIIKNSTKGSTFRIIIPKAKNNCNV